MSPVRMDGYAPLRHYAVLGDTRTTALVALDGAVDWLPVPRMDTPPIFAALLDPHQGGSITVSPTVEYEVSRRYRDASLVLETTYRTEEGTVRVTDALNLGALGALPWTELARVIEVEAGRVPMAWSVRPGNRFATARPWAYRRDGVAMMVVGDQHLAVVTEGTGAARVDARSISGQFMPVAGSVCVLAVVATAGEPVHVPSAGEIAGRVEATTKRWQGWSAQVCYRGPAPEMVLRSALTIKALTSQSSGGIAGAATTSLPEKLGGKRNFDYRFAWIRDASFALDAVGSLGLSEETHAGIAWLLRAVAQEAPALRVFYSLGAEPVSAEMKEVTGAPGYRGSMPVHSGNSAASQMQLGAYGDLIDAVWRYTNRGGRLDAGTAAMLAGMADRVCDIWGLPDAGLWELGDRQLYTSSKIGCWTALDRVVRLAEAGQIASLHVERWASGREDIRAWTDEHCWSVTKQAYTFYAGTDDLDAAVLLAARTGFCAGGDPRLRTTVDAIRSELTAGGPLLYRYSRQRDKEGAFLACSCWLVEALVHIGRVSEARELFEAFLEWANDVGLYTEEIDPSTGDMLGNIPQTLTHLAVIGAATSLAGVLDGGIQE